MHRGVHYTQITLPNLSSNLFIYSNLKHNIITAHVPLKNNKQFIGFSIQILLIIIILKPTYAKLIIYPLVFLN